MLHISLSCNKKEREAWKISVEITIPTQFSCRSRRANMCRLGFRIKKLTADCWDWKLSIFHMRIWLVYKWKISLIRVYDCVLHLASNEQRKAFFTMRNVIFSFLHTFPTVSQFSVKATISRKLPEKRRNSHEGNTNSFVSEIARIRVSNGGKKSDHCENLSAFETMKFECVEKLWTTERLFVKKKFQIPRSSFLAEIKQKSQFVLLFLSGSSAKGKND
jgi:hypothetical protein